MPKRKFATFASNLGSDWIDVYVGYEQEHFHVSKTALYKKSEVFRSIVNRDLNDIGKMYLKDDDPDTFSWFVEWLYRDNSELLSVNDHDLEKARFYNFAMKYNMTPLMDAILKSIQRGIVSRKTRPGIEVMTYVFQTCKGDCALKSEMVKNFVKTFNSIGKHGVLSPSSELGWTTNAMLALFNSDDRDLQLEIWNEMIRSRSYSFRNANDPAALIT